MNAETGPLAAAFGVQDLTVTYGSRVALHEVTLAIPRGQVTAVVGSDGSGKTTLARALAGARRAASGRVVRPTSQQIGYVSAATGAYRDLTVMENLEFSASAYGVRGATLRTRADELLDRTGLTAARDRLGGQLSGGMRQKLAVAMALLHRPGLLVLDEPTTGVDPVSRAELWRLIAAAAAGGAAVLFTTSYLDEAERATTVLVLDRGATLLSGEPSDIVAGTPGVIFAAPALRGAARPDDHDAPDSRSASMSEDTRRVDHSWRLGSTRRIWSPDGPTPAGATRVATTFADAVIIASLRRREGAA